MYQINQECGRFEKWWKVTEFTLENVFIMSVNIPEELFIRLYPSFLTPSPGLKPKSYMKHMKLREEIWTLKLLYYFFILIVISNSWVTGLKFF